MSHVLPLSPCNTSPWFLSNILPSSCPVFPSSLVFIRWFNILSSSYLMCRPYLAPVYYATMFQSHEYADILPSNILSSPFLCRLLVQYLASFFLKFCSRLV
jgi:hypothetical protein